MPDPDPRVDPLGAAAILTDTQFRLSFAPRDPDERVIALQFQARKAKIDQMQSLMQLGEVHVQVKAGFAAERHVVYTGPEIILLMDAFDRLVTELPAAQRAKPLDDLPQG